MLQIISRSLRTPSVQLCGLPRNLDIEKLIAKIHDRLPDAPHVRLSHSKDYRITAHLPFSSNEEAKHAREALASLRFQFIKVRVKLITTEPPAQQSQQGLVFKEDPYHKFSDANYP